jgi:hypothetical protein
MKSLNYLYIKLELDDSLIAGALIGMHRSTFLIAIQVKWSVR